MLTITRAWHCKAVACGSTSYSESILANACELLLRNHRLWERHFRVELQQLHVVLSVGLLDSFREIFLLQLVQAFEIQSTLSLFFLVSKLCLDLLKSRV